MLCQYVQHNRSFLYKLISNYVLKLKQNEKNSLVLLRSKPSNVKKSKNIWVTNKLTILLPITILKKIKFLI